MAFLSVPLGQNVLVRNGCPASPADQVDDCSVDGDIKIGREVTHNDETQASSTVMLVTVSDALNGVVQRFAE
eukprot:4105249-Prorocentrum_lima.AAC.1